MTYKLLVSALAILLFLASPAPAAQLSSLVAPALAETTAVVPTALGFETLIRKAIIITA